ncbi:MAG: hypothetical protein JWN08_2090 [Frankiales bacterium]|nr:hypothetical protein [Frankiales bacterium]
MSLSAKTTQTVTRAGAGGLTTPVVQLSLTELATVAMLVEGAHTMDSEQSRLALAREDVLSSALRQLKRALVEAGAVQDGPGWRPRAD